MGNQGDTRLSLVSFPEFSYYFSTQILDACVTMMDARRPLLPTLENTSKHQTVDNNIEGSIFSDYRVSLCRFIVCRLLSSLVSNIVVFYYFR